MSRSTRPTGVGTAWYVAIGVGGVSIVAALLGHPALAELVGGGAIVCVSFLFGRPLTQRVRIETDPRRVLVWNVLLALIIVLALIGVGVMAAAIP